MKKIIYSQKNPVNIVQKMVMYYQEYRSGKTVIAIRDLDDSICDGNIAICDRNIPFADRNVPVTDRNFLRSAPRNSGQSRENSVCG
jgi:hypothetical protein